MTKKRGLGRGLGALIPEIKKEENTVEELNNYAELDESSSKVFDIKLEDISVNKNNPRKNFDDENLQSLADSIKQYGLIQPLVLQKKGKKYEIVAGERRFRAAKLLKLETVPAILKDLSEKDKDMITMIENIQREDLNPYEEAQAYNNIMKQYNMTQQELSDLLGKSRTYIANTVRLLSLDDLTITELEKGNITTTQARALLGIKDIFERKKYLDLLIKKEITVNQVEKLGKKATKIKPKDVFIRDIEERLKESIGAKVNIVKTKNKWKVNIEFSNDEDIEEFLLRYGIEE